MIRNICKWANRCLGWVFLACLAIGLVCGYLTHRKIGYGQLEIRLMWNGRDYDLQTLVAAEMQIRGKTYAWRPGDVIRLRPGAAALQLKLPHFRSCSITTNVFKDTKTVAELGLEAEPRMISVQNVISNAMINGERCQGTWTIRNAEVGRSYRVEATAPGYHTNVLTLVIQSPGQDLVTNLTWRPLTGRVFVRVIPVMADTSFSLDGLPFDSSAGELITVGNHVLNVSNSDYYPWNQRVLVESERTNYWEVILKPRPAMLTVDVTPSVQFQLQGKAGELIELTNGVATLWPGTNNLLVTAKGYTAQQQTFIVQPNKNYRWRVEFEREGLSEFKKAKTRFEALKSNSDLQLLEQYGGPEWGQLQKIQADNEDLKRAAQQYSQACTDLVELLKRSKIRKEEQARLEQEKAEERARADAQKAEERARLERLKAEEQARAYKVAAHKQALMEEAQRMRDRIEQTFRGRTGDEVAWGANMSSARRLVREYEEKYGEGTEYDKVVGSVAEEVKEWRRRIDVSRGGR